MVPVHAESLPISLIAHQAFCPRRAWLESVGEKSDSAQMQAGTSSHSRTDEAQASRKQNLTAIDVFHDEWGVTGRLDVVTEHNEGITIREYKATPVRRKVQITPAMRVQLALQRECLTSMGHRVVGTEIYFCTHNRTVPVELDDDDVADARELVKKTRATVLSDTAPPPLEDSPRCTRCSHAGVCLPDERRLSAGARRIVVSDPDAQVVHLSTPGSRASLRAGTIIVEKHGERIGEVPVELAQSLQVHGNIDLSSALIRELLWRDVPILWCSGTGRQYGFAQSTHGPNGYQRVQQHVASAEGRLAIAREFVCAKVANQRTKLRRASAPANVLTALSESLRRASNSETWQELIGSEGEAASIYFANWPILLSAKQRSSWSWSGRSGRPATDEINALLNYGYSLLTGDAIKAISSAGLDPHAGFLRSSKRNKPALALDLMEEFRAPVVDSVVQRLINNGEVSPSQFSSRLGSMRMDDKARRSLIGAYERRMTTEIRHPVFGYSATWRRTMEIQARQVLGVLDGSQAAYVGVRVR